MADTEGRGKREGQEREEEVGRGIQRQRRYGRWGGDADMGDRRGVDENEKKRKKKVWRERRNKEKKRKGRGGGTSS